jgi:hypothetical protein
MAMTQRRPTRIKQPKVIPAINMMSENSIFGYKGFVVTDNATSAAARSSKVESKDGNGANDEVMDCMMA